MTLRVKICGLGSAAEVAMTAGADACGVIVESPAAARSLALPNARAVLESVPRGVLRVAVTTLTDPVALADLGASLPIDLLQPHAVRSLTVMQQLRALLPTRVGLIIVVPIPPAGGGDAAMPRSQAGSPPPLPDLGRGWVLLDTQGTGGTGGTGLQGDWGRARVLRDGMRDRPVFLAGGLRPDNVAAAVRSVQPDGIDASSGLERDGSKDPSLISALIDRAREAAP